MEKESVFMSGRICILKSKFHTWRNQEQIKVTECLLSYGAELFVFQFAIQKYKH